MHLRLRILAVFAAVLGLIALANFLDQWRQADSRALASLADQARQADQASKERVVGEGRHLTALASSLMERPDWADAMVAGDRETLFALAQPHFAAWQKDLDITHFYFHRRDGTNILRVHLKERYGDSVDRRSFKQALTTGRPASAIEIGLTGEWVLRVVVPWRRGDQLIGFLELGMDMEGIYQKSLEPLGTTYLALMLKRSIPDPQVWETRRQAIGFSPFPWDTLPDQVINVQTGAAIDLQAFHAALDATRIFEFSNRGRAFYAMPRPLLGSNGHERIGTEFFLVDAEPLRTEARQRLLVVVASEALLFALLLWGLHGYLGRIESQVEMNAAHLQQAVDDRTRELRAHQQHLESLVEQRTAHLRTALASAQDAARAKNAFIDNMTHELNTPIHGIMGMTSLALGTRLDDEQREYLNSVMASASDLHHLIEDILTFTHGDPQSSHCRHIPFDLAELVRAALAHHQTAAADKGLILESDVDASIPVRLRGDADKIDQILEQLLDNAIKFTATGTIRLNVEPEKLDESGITLRFIVADSGPGIPAEQIRHLFDPFAQGNTSATRPHGGTGLGLAIARQLAVVIGGQLRVETAEGSGSRFLLTVPLQPQPA